MRRAICLCAMFAAALASGQGQDNGVVLTAKRALLLDEPQLIVGQSVKSLDASPDGRYLVMYRETPSPAPLQIGGRRPEPLRKDFVVWDSVGGTTKEVRVADDVRSWSKPDWLPGTDRMILSLMGVRVQVSNSNDPNAARYPMMFAEYYLFDASDAKLTKLSTQNLSLGAESSFGVSPIAPIAVEVGFHHDANGNQVFLRTINSDGAVTKSAVLPEKYANPGRYEWSKDGRELLVEVQRPPENGGLYFTVIIHYDPMTAEYSETIGPIASYVPPVVGTDVRLDGKPARLEEGSAQGINVSWWLRSTTDSERPVALVSEHAEFAVLPKGEKYVAFLVKGTVFVRRTIDLSVDQYHEMLEAAKRAVLISNAKQIALGAIMYSADYDDVLPPNLGKDDLMPYLRNENVFKEGWVYTFAGGNLNDVKDPANTVLGYIEGNGGRAVAYVDGHVKWVPNQ